MSGDVRTLFVRVWDPVNVATVLSISSVTVVLEALEARPVPPAIVSASLLRSISIVPLSLVTSRSSAVI